PGCGGRTACSHFDDECACGGGQTQALDEFRRYLVDWNAEPASRNFSICPQLLQYRLGTVRRYGETNANRTAIGGIDRRVDADNVALEVKGRAPRIAPVHRCVDLEKVVVRTGVDVAPAPGNNPAAD